jgi:hypothetical protein
MYSEAGMSKRFQELTFLNPYIIYSVALWDVSIPAGIDVEGTIADCTPARLQANSQIYTLILASLPPNE